MNHLISNYTLARLFLDGMLCMMILYGLLAWIQERKVIYWQYALYIACMVVTFQLDDQDYTKANYAPGSNYYVVVMETLAFWLYIRFAVLLMDIRSHDSFSYRVLQGMVVLLILHVLLDTGLTLADVPVAIRSQIYTFNRYALAIGALIVVPRILRLRQVVVVYFIVGSFFFVAGCLLALSVNFIPSLFTRQLGNPFTYPVTYMELGVVAEVLCFTLGLSRLNHLNELEKIQVQEQLIDQLQENDRKQQKLIRIRDDIARDLHDDVGSDLSAISLLSKSAVNLVQQRPEQVVEVLHTISQTARHILGSLRDIVWSLNSTQGTYESLTFRMQEMAFTLFNKTSVHLNFDFSDTLPDGLMPPDQRRDVYLLYKESLHNILRHAHARNVWVQLSVTDHQMALSIKDDGQGFVTDQPCSGSGLQFLRHRAEALGGELQLDSQPGKGTCIRLRCPVGELADV